MIPIGLKLLRNKVIAKISCRLKFSAAMGSRFVETHEEFIEEMQMRTKTQKKVRTTGLTLSNNGQKQEEKMSNLKAMKYQSLTRPSIILPFI